MLSCLGIALVLSLRGGAPAATISAIVAAGFLVAYFIQGKYFSYHVFPAAPFSALAAWVVILRNWSRLGQASFQTRVAEVGIYGLAACAIAVLFVRVRRWATCHARLDVGECAFASPRPRRVAYRGHILSPGPPDRRLMGRPYA